MSVYKEVTKFQNFSVEMCILGLFHFKNVNVLCILYLINKNLQDGTSTFSSTFLSRHVLAVESVRNF